MSFNLTIQKKRILVFCLLVAVTSPWISDGIAGKPYSSRKNLFQNDFTPGDSSEKNNFKNQSYIRSLQIHTETAIQQKRIIFNVFVNPVSNEFLIHFKPCEPGLLEIKVFNSEGALLKLVYSQLTANYEDVRVNFGVADLKLTKGNYYVLVKNEKETFLKKLVFY